MSAGTERENRTTRPGTGHQGFQIQAALVLMPGSRIIGARYRLEEAQNEFDDAIAAGAAAGLSTREIGLLAGMTHTAVIKRLHKREERNHAD